MSQNLCESDGETSVQFEPPVLPDSYAPCSNYCSRLSRRHLPSAVLQRYGGEWIVTDKEEAKFFNLGWRLIAGPYNGIHYQQKERSIRRDQLATTATHYIETSHHT